MVDMECSVKATLRNICIFCNLAPIQFQSVIHLYTAVVNIDSCTHAFVMIALLIKN